jgi:hypothetical protein
MYVPSQTRGTGSNMVESKTLKSKTVVIDCEYDADEL